jgi:hypothetical protein
MSSAQRREQLISVGRHIFAEKGLDATSVEEVAARADNCTSHRKQQEHESITTSSTAITGHTVFRTFHTEPQAQGATAMDVL